MKSVLYLGCPAPERADTEKLLGAVDVSVVWGENASFALDELQRVECRCWLIFPAALPRSRSRARFAPSAPPR